jgi:O-antigen/teichoic acid export membrane protein
MSSLTQKVVGGLLWNFVGTAGNAVLQVATVAVLARLVEPREFGMLAAAVIVINFSTIFTQLGVVPAVVRHPALTPAHVQSASTLSLLIGGAFAAVLGLCAPLVGDLFGLKEDGLPTILRVLSMLFVVQAFGAISEALLQREFKFRQLALIDVASYAVGNGAVAIGLAARGFGVWALVAGQLCQALIKTALLCLARPHARGIRVHRASLADLLNFGAGFTLAKLFNFAALQGDKVVVARWLGAANLGSYSQAYQFIVMPANLFGAVLDRVLFPAMAAVQEQPERLARAYERSIRMSLMVTAPISVAVCVLAPEIVSILLGAKWGDVVAPLQILATGLAFRTAYKMSDSLTRAKGAVYRRAWRQAVYAGVVILGSLIGQCWGIAGVAWSVTIAIAINYLLMAQLSLTLVPLGLVAFVAAHRPAVVVALTCGIPVFEVAELLRGLGLDPIVIVATVICSGALILVVGFAFFPKVLLGEDANAWKTLLVNFRTRIGKTAAAGARHDGR